MMDILKKVAALIALLSICLPPQSVMAWSEETHMTTGAIAFDDLAANDPALIAELEQILTAHPHYKTLAGHAAGLTGADRTRVMFEWLARWPDDINGTAFEHRDWHYELRVVYGWTYLWPFRNGNASTAFDQNFRTLSDKTAPARERAIALGWLMHVTGDIQQPLHAGHQMTGQFWTTDEAGTLAFVRKTAGGGGINLHQYWDKILDVPGADGKVTGETTSRAWAKPLQSQIPRETIYGLVHPGTAQQQFEIWLNESKLLAKRAAYKGSYLRASDDESNAPIVTPHEIRFAQELSKRRVATGGYRIADVVRMALR